MTTLTIYHQDNPGLMQVKTSDADDIREHLAGIGVRFERWQADADLPADADNDSILAAYQQEIDRLVEAEGYRSWDVVSLQPDHPQKDEFRRKFLDEHTHSEDEVRFFVRGQGLFFLHPNDSVYAVLCEKDDLISVPMNTPHWFDMGPNPDFCAIRLFNNPDGWVANFTGTTIAGRFPKLEN